MTDTQALIISLAKSLSDLLVIDYILYLDNLFSNILLAKILEKLDIDIMSMIWVNILRFSLELVQLKQVKQSLKWEHLKTAEADEIDCFLWQDNNQILDMTTVYNLTDTIIRARKRSSHTSTYASITRSVFENFLIKELSIPVDINAYNHYMREVDIENQYWAGFTTLQHQNQYY